MKAYDFKSVEKKWQDKWEDAGVFHAVDFSEKPKFYGLVEFPYPSGAGMHVGHIKRATMSCSRSALTPTASRPRTMPSRPACTPVR